MKQRKWRLSPFAILDERSTNSGRLHRYEVDHPTRADDARSTSAGRKRADGIRTEADDHEEYRYLPDEEGLFDTLVPQYLKGIIYGALVDAFASEQAARMTAMDAATKNAEEMLGRLGLIYNRARQAAITSEVSEIVAGAAALED
jgi:F-type H+-transporting ATPase subunit gamma